MDIINTPSYHSDGTGPWWDSFYSRVSPWPEGSLPPARFVIVGLGENRKFVYEPMAPFNLEKDECSEWVSWTPLTTACGTLI